LLSKKKKIFCRRCWKELPVKENVCLNCRRIFDRKDPFSYYSVKFGYLDFIEYHTFWLLLLLTPPLIFIKIPLYVKMILVIIAGHLLSPGRSPSHGRKAAIVFWITNEIYLGIHLLILYLFS